MLATLSPTAAPRPWPTCRGPVGFALTNSTWAFFPFPMSDAHGEVIGIRLRLPSGRKLSVKGGREGLFLPSDLSPDRCLLIAEGPTDVASLLDLGFPAVGRPSCRGGARLVVQLVQTLRPERAVVVADGDGPGLCGAEKLADQLLACLSDVRVVAPPDGIKDARAWKRRGATEEDINAAIEAASARQLVVTATRKKNAGVQNGRR